MDEQRTAPPAKPVKGILFGILFLAIFSAIYGVIRIRQNLNPYASELSAISSQASSSIAASPNDTLIQKTKDTDGDGLSDYDELTIYKTSVFLKDSDSDGFDDKQEIVTGNDPNCPKGQQCGLPEMKPLPASTTEPIQPVVPLTGAPTATIPPFSPDTFREQLRKSGMAEEQIQSLDDVTLKQVYDQTASEMSGQTGEGTSEALQNLSPEQIRELLKANGIAEEMLKQIDDATLQKIFEDTMKGQGQ